MPFAIKKIGLGLLKIVFSLAVVSTLLLYLTRSRSVIFSFAVEPDAVRPRNYCILNPFRDKAPEIIAESYLEKMCDGDVESIRPFLQHEADQGQHITANERKWPIQSWRIGRRADKADETEMMYWVTRGGGYSGEEEVHFRIKKSADAWSLKSYSAIY
jgi:hypothetical protein